MAKISIFDFQIVLFIVLFLNLNEVDSRQHKKQTPHDVNNERRISAKKCHEYAEYKDDISSTTNLSLSLLEGDSVCTTITQSRYEDFLNEKQNLPPGLMKYPHMALIGCIDSKAANDIHWVCGGSLISENYVLTSARCLQEPVHYVLLGELDISSDDDIAKPTVYSIVKTIIHPNYNKNQLYNDIALIKLNETIQIDEYIRPACLHQMHKINAKEAVATGWGLNEHDRKHDHLQEVDLDMISFGNCSATYLEMNYTGLAHGIDDDTHICAGSYTSGKDTCAGDGGGPLQIYHSKYKCMFDLIGITSFGSRKCGTKKPGVYTRVSSYLNWIESIVWPESELKVAIGPRLQTSCDGWQAFCFFYRIFH